jgi:hypothetical protein
MYVRSHCHAADWRVTHQNCLWLSSKMEGRKEGTLTSITITSTHNLASCHPAINSMVCTPDRATLNMLTNRWYCHPVVMWILTISKEHTAVVFIVNHQVLRSNKQRFMEVVSKPSSATIAQDVLFISYHNMFQPIWWPSSGEYKLFKEATIPTMDPFCFSTNLIMYVSCRQLLSLSLLCIKF